LFLFLLLTALFFQLLLQLKLIYIITVTVNWRNTAVCWRQWHCSMSASTYKVIW